MKKFNHLKKARQMNIDGPSGLLQARHDAAPAPRGIQAVLCHPHPEYGGTMDDTVLDRLAALLLDCGAGVLRFNFRGVGGSYGKHSGGPGEVEDLLAAAGWLRRQFPADRLWAGGYSFGAWVTWQALGQGLPAERVLLVSPPVGPMAFETRPGNVRVDVVAGSEDDFIDPAALAEWEGVTVRQVEGADHFFSGHQAELRTALREAVGEP